jgi:hypothetical protein
MWGSSSSTPHHGTEVTSSRQPQTAAHDKTVGSSSRQAAHLAREDQRTISPHVAPSGTGAFESQRSAPRQADPPRRPEERPASARQLYDGSDHPNSDSLQRCRSRGRGSRQTRRRGGQSHRKAGGRKLAAPPIFSGGRLDAERTAGDGVWRRPAALVVVTYTGRRSPGRPCFPCCRRGPRTNSGHCRDRRFSPQADGGTSSRRRGGGSKWSSPLSRRARSAQPPSRARSV